MKKCSRCQIHFELTEFYNDTSKKDGLCVYCKNCSRIRFRLKREKYNAAFKLKDKRYYEKHKEEIIAKRKSSYQLNKHKHKARHAVRTALFKGIITRPVLCQKCQGDKKIEAHHPDYSRPLEVMWLCNTCHRREDFGK